MDTKPTSICIFCPICGSDSRSILNLPFEYTQKKLEFICNANFSPAITYPDYELLRCEGCTLEFAYPLTAPSNQFYLWLTNQSFPYVESRWEWSQAVSLLKNLKDNIAQNLCLVDIGCGTGNFLKVVKKELQFNAIGIDHNNDVIQQCVNDGLDAYCGDVSHIENIYPKGADVITLWHILEHVSAPIELLKNLRSQLSDNGLILISVPLSPMTAETLQLDPLNLPPHHLTRWNSKSLTALSNKLEMKVEFYYPKPSNILYMQLKALIFSSNQGKLNLTKWTKLKLLLAFMACNICSVVQSFIKLKERQKNNSIHDIVLLKLTKN